MPNRERRTNELIHCENCGEDYAATYRCCPFCEERPTRGRGGNRLKSNTRGGGYGGGPSPLRVLGWVLSLALIVAACVIVFNLLGSLLGGKDDPESTPSAPVETVEPSEPSPEEQPSQQPTPMADAAGITLGYQDVTLSANESLNLKPSVAPADWSGTIVWTTDSAAAVVSADGVVTNANTGASKVKVTVTATAGTKTATCAVYCAGGSTGATPGTTSPGTTTAAPLTLNKTDFTIRAQDPNSVQITASGGSGSYQWTSSNTGVATVSADGTVTKVGKGQCTITCKSGESSATCVVRVS